MQPGALPQLARRLLRVPLLRGWFTARTTSYPGSPDARATIVMCLWNRPSRMEEILRMLDEQEGSPGIRLLLWNNNRADHEHYSRVIRAFRARGALSTVKLVRSYYNVGSIGRFYWARKWASRAPGEPVIVIDDDQVLEPTFVRKALASFDPGALVAWWAWAMNSGYHDRTRVAPGAVAEHIGPGGSVMPIDFFADDRFFTALPDRYRLLDDLWISYFAREKGFELRSLDVQIEFVMDETNQFHGQKDLKTEFYEYLYGPGADERRPRLTP